MKPAYLTSGNTALCCGCRACEQSCSKQAIRMEENHEGFLYPVLESALCVDCGLCQKVCPMEQSDEVKLPVGKTYAAYNKNTETRKKSSSGGIFSVIAHWVLKNEGAVYGAAFDDKLYLSHRRVTTENELSALMGSKYLQSDTTDTYQQVKQDLKSGVMVYYVGTPCQIAGLHLFLRKEYPNLITSDLVCHGIPSPKMFRVFTRTFEEKKDVRIVDYKFRDKRFNGWSCSSSSSSIDIKTGKRREYLYDDVMNAYLNAFLSGSISREVCYECPFANVHRSGDLTIADYWGVRNFHPQMDYKDGVSLIIVNTTKGETILRNISKELELVESQLDWAVEENINIKQPTVRPAARSSSYTRAFDSPGDFVRSHYSKKRFKQRCIFELKRCIKANETIYTAFKFIKRKIQ